MIYVILALFNGLIFGGCAAIADAMYGTHIAGGCFWFAFIGSLFIMCIVVVGSSAETSND